MNCVHSHEGAPTPTCKNNRKKSKASSNAKSHPKSNPQLIANANHIEITCERNFKQEGKRKDANFGFAPLFLHGSALDW